MTTATPDAALAAALRRAAAAGSPAVHRSDSITALRAAFRAAAAPDLQRLVGVHQAFFAGPLWLRSPSPLAIAVLGMPGWAGKRFPGPVVDGVLAGCNLRRSGGELAPSLPMTARVEAAALDGRAAIVAQYSDGAPRPWRSVRDEFRALGPEVLLGLSYGLTPTSGGLPFLLLRRG